MLLPRDEIQAKKREPNRVSGGFVEHGLVNGPDNERRHLWNVRKSGGFIRVFIFIIRRVLVFRNKLTNNFRCVFPNKIHVLLYPNSLTAFASCMYVCMGLAKYIYTGESGHATLYPPELHECRRRRRRRRGGRAPTTRKPSKTLRKGR